MSLSNFIAYTKFFSKVSLLSIVIVVIASCSRSGDSVPVTIIFPTPVATTIKGDDPTSLPEENLPPTTSVDDISPLIISYDIKYKCNNEGKIVSAVIEVFVAGGIPPIKIAPMGTITAKPGKKVSVFGSSSSETGDPKASVDIVIPYTSDTCPPSEDTSNEICNNGIDDDGDGKIDEGCKEICDNGIDDDGDGKVDEGCKEICDNGIDDDGDGKVDEGCPGCTDPIATNYNPFATVDDGSCKYVLGCTDPNATNYDPLATKDNGSCTYLPTPDFPQKECNDNHDNDNDGQTDYPADSDCTGKNDDSE